MRIDGYTKVVLTIIAACLVWLSVGGPNLLPTAHAQVGTNPRVLIAGWVDVRGQVHDLGEVKDTGLPVNIVAGR